MLGRSKEYFKHLCIVSSMLNYVHVRILGEHKRAIFDICMNVFFQKLKSLERSYVVRICYLVMPSWHHEMIP